MGLARSYCVCIRSAVTTLISTAVVIDNICEVVLIDYVNVKTGSLQWRNLAENAAQGKPVLK